MASWREETWIFLSKRMKEGHFYPWNWMLHCWIREKSNSGIAMGRSKQFANVKDLDQRIQNWSWFFSMQATLCIVWEKSSIFTLNLGKIRCLKFLKVQDKSHFIPKVLLFQAFSEFDIFHRTFDNFQMPSVWIMNFWVYL